MRKALLELPRPKIVVTSRYFQYPAGKRRGLTSIFAAAAVAAGRSRTSATMAKASRPGTRARKNTVRMLVCTQKRSASASSGPMNAPALSPKPSRPNARPRSCSATDSATSASRGADRVPVPMRSRSRAPRTPSQIVASPISGLASAAATNPAMAIALCRLRRSDSDPEKPWTMFCVACAVPSIRPTMLPLTWSVCVRKIGRIG